MSTNIHAAQKPLIYQIGKHIKLVDDATFCKSIIADGKELITGKESGEIRVPELNDEKVYITFKEDLTSLANAFSGCAKLTSIPENLFANCPKATDFSFTFFGCKALTTIPEKLFANNPAVTDFTNTFMNCMKLTAIPTGLFAHNPEVTDFSGTFALCSALESIPKNIFANNRKVTDFSYTFTGWYALTGESPYTMIGDKKVHLYERANYPEHFTKLTVFWECFKNCTGLTDYAQIPTNWKE